MWQLLDRTPFATLSSFARDVNGREVWCVAVRATFEIQFGGRLRLAEVQEPVVLSPEYTGEDDALLHSDSDIMPFVPGTEAILRGTVRAPEEALAELPVEMRVGEICKRALIVGPREAQRSLLGWSVSRRAPVEDTPLDWMHAVGGRSSVDETHWDMRNPVGRGFDRKHSRGIPLGYRIHLPQILDPIDVDPPVGFGPIHRHWAPRAALAGTFDSAWEIDRAPLLPEDHDIRFGYSAPLDQTTASPLRGGETVLLRGFSAEGPIQFELPQIVLAMNVRFGTRAQSCGFALTRIEIDLDHNRLGMVWNATFDVNGRDEKLRGGRVWLKQMAGVLS